MDVWVDFDDVVCETAVELAAFAAAEFGKRPRALEEMEAFDLRVSLELSPAEYGPFMERFHREKLAGIPGIPGAASALRGWIRDGVAAPVVVTGRPVWSRTDSLAWLAARGLDGVELLHVDKYGRAADAAGWTPFADLRARGFALAVDDAPGALAALASSGLCPYAVFDRPWNRSWAPPAGAPHPAARFRAWPEIDRFVRDLAAR